LAYFPHDVDATTDPKLEPVILRYGAAAYAFYFVHLEYCYRSPGFSVDVSATETGAEMRAVIQQKLHINETEYEQILQAYLRRGAFDAEIYEKTGRITSNGIQKRAEKILEKRENEQRRYRKKASSHGLLLHDERISAAETQPEKHSFCTISGRVSADKRKQKKIKENNNNNAGADVVVVSPPSGEGTESPCSIPRGEAEELAALYTEVTGLDDLSQEYLTSLMMETNVSGVYVRKKIAMLNSPEIRAPLPWFVAAIKNDYRAAQKKADKPKNGGRANPSCPDCAGGGWRMVTIDDTGYPNEYAEPCPCAGQAASAGGVQH
jgi:hypothetical protein